MGVKILRRKALLAKLGFSSATLHRKIVAGEFPPPLVLGPNMRGWTEETADDYITSLKIDVNPCPVAPGAKRGRKPNTNKGGKND
ncbi:MAG: hypothetical protein FD174_609 [Geobacteraceae bacterium]|nr:MAG: hypothetical protein FD174_609 [Geobacteraceae bacterium]